MDLERGQPQRLGLSVLRQQWKCVSQVNNVSSLNLGSDNGQSVAGDAGVFLLLFKGSTQGSCRERAIQRRGPYARGAEGLAYISLFNPHRKAPTFSMSPIPLKADEETEAPCPVWLSQLQ